MPLQYEEIGRRLRAFRLGSGLSADEVADRLGISRTALYRFEKGELAKIDTLERLSELLQVSLPTLLGVGIEYIPSAVSYFERVRQLEEDAEHIVVLAGPISFLLGSDSFEMALEQVLRESIPDDLPNRNKALEDVDKIMEILHERKRAYRKRRPPIVNLISAMQIEPFLNNGLVGRVSLTESKKAMRREMARAEIEHFAAVIEEESIGVQIGLVTDSLPHTGFQIFRRRSGDTLMISPFRLGEQPNIRVGVAMATSAPEALALHENVVKEVWRTAIKGRDAAAYLRDLLNRNQERNRARPLRERSAGTARR
ncbi:helix-turn-helix domain-containing protein [Faunimonas sp. B44]|uniref:helix-turn-helix domain-containing protein n=1 Tax=Faunimonas sp. B44 TaxID=3461493 RepID=UPI004043DE31